MSMIVFKVAVALLLVAFGIVGMAYLLAWSWWLICGIIGIGEDV